MIDLVSASSCLRVQKNAPAMSVKLQLCLLVQRNVSSKVFGCFSSSWVQKNAAAIVLVALCVCGFKKIYPRCCRLLFVFAGSKKYTRDVVGYSLCLRVQKNAPVMSVKSRLCLWVQKNVPQCCWYSLCLQVHKNAPAMSVKSRLCLWVQKNVPAIVLVAFRVYGFKKMYPQ